MREMAGYQNIARFASQPISDPFGLIVGLEIARGRECCQRITCAPARLGGLTGAQLPTVPDDCRPHTVFRELRGEPRDMFPTARRERTLRIDVRPDRLAVMHEQERHND